MNIKIHKPIFSNWYGCKGHLTVKLCTATMINTESHRDEVVTYSNYISYMLQQRKVKKKKLQQRKQKRKKGESRYLLTYFNHAVDALYHRVCTLTIKLLPSKTSTLYQMMQRAVHIFIPTFILLQENKLQKLLNFTKK